MDSLKSSKVGSFYCIGDNLVYMSMELQYLPTNNFSYNYGGHNDIWQIFTETDEFSYYQELDDTYYFPRGRIVYMVNTGRFIIYIDPKAYTNKMIDKLVKIYCLDAELCDVVTDDEHYNVSTQPEADIIADEIDNDFDIDEYIRTKFGISEEEYRDVKVRHRVTTLLTGNEFNNIL